MALVIFIQDTIDAEQLLVIITECFYLLTMALTVSAGGRGMLAMHARAFPLWHVTLLLHRQLLVIRAGLVGLRLLLFLFSHRTLGSVGERQEGEVDWEFMSCLVGSAAIWAATHIIFL